MGLQFEAASKERKRITVFVLTEVGDTERQHQENFSVTGSCYDSVRNDPSEAFLVSLSSGNQSASFE